MTIGVALIIEGLETPWQVRNRFDVAACALADRHYSRRPSKRFSGQLGGVGRTLTLVSPCERALWVTRYMQRPMDGLDAWRNTYFHNEGAGLSSELITAAMELTRRLWGQAPADGWVTWIDTRKVKPTTNPGYCFKQAGWWLDREYVHRRLVRLRAAA